MIGAPGTQSDLQPADTVFFMHVPKTAGTSLTSVLLPHFDTRRIWSSHEATSLLKVSDLSNFQYLGGHIPYWMARSALDKEPVTLTMLRDPVKRYLSNYLHLGRAGSRGNDAERAAATMPLEQLLSEENRPLARRYRNRQATFMASLLAGTPEETGLAFEQLLADGPRPSASDATARLDTFAWVGITEHFQASMDLLCFRFGWRPLARVPRENVTPRSMTDESDWVRERLLEENEIDLVLYRHALERFRQEYAEMLRSLSETAGRTLDGDDPAAITAALEQHYVERSRRRGTLKERVHFTLDRAVHTAGWHGGEFTEGLPYRWTGPESEAELDLPLAAGRDCLFRCRMPFSISDEMRSGLTIACNGTDLQLEQFVEGDSTIVTARIPRELLDPNLPFARFSFRTPPAMAVAGDDRLLGVSIAWVLIWPMDGPRPEAAPDT